MGIEQVLLGARGIELPDPLDTARKGVALADLSSQNQMRQYALKAVERKDRATQALGQLLPELQRAGWSDVAMQAALTHPLVQQNPDVAGALLDTFDAQRKSQVEAEKSRAGAAKDRADAMKNSLGLASNYASSIVQSGQVNPMDAQRLVSQVAHAYQIGGYDPKDLNIPALGSSPEVFMQFARGVAAAGQTPLDAARQKEIIEGNLPHKQAETRKAQEETRLAPLKFEDEQKHRRVTEAQGWVTANRPTIQATDDGLFSIPRGGTTATPITTATGEPLVKAGAGKLTETQGTATAFALRMRDARAVIDKLEATDAVDPSGQLVAHAGGQGWIGTPMNTIVGAVNPQAQVYEQAKRNWVTANARKESGAAIPPAELEQEMRKWFPVPGDRADVIASKRAARETAEQAMLIQAGPGGKKVPEPTVPQASAAKGKFSAVTPTGKTVYFPDEASMNAAKMQWERIGGR